MIDRLPYEFALAERLRNWNRTQKPNPIVVGFEHSVAAAAIRLGLIQVKNATVREAEDAFHIECRFDDGQKYAAIQVDLENEALAHWICELLNWEENR